MSIHYTPSPASALLPLAAFSIHRSEPRVLLLQSNCALSAALGLACIVTKHSRAMASTCLHHPESLWEAAGAACASVVAGLLSQPNWHCCLPSYSGLHQESQAQVGSCAQFCGQNVILKGEKRQPRVALHRRYPLPKQGYLQSITTVTQVSRRGSCTTWRAGLLWVDDP